MKPLFNKSPTSAIEKNNTKAAGMPVIVPLNVQVKFRKKLLATAVEKPAELATYLFNLSFSFSIHVIKKSTQMPDNPTMPNFNNF